MRMPRPSAPRGAGFLPAALWPLLAAVLAALLASPASAYYHYVHYNRNAPGNPILERFDPSVKTVTFFVNDQGPAVLAPGDSFGSVLGELKQALSAWDSVSTSDL